MYIQFQKKSEAYHCKWNRKEKVTAVGWLTADIALSHWFPRMTGMVGHLSRLMEKACKWYHQKPRCRPAAICLAHLKKSLPWSTIATSPAYWVVSLEVKLMQPSKRKDPKFLQYITRIQKSLAMILVVLFVRLILVQKEMTGEKLNKCLEDAWRQGAWGMFAQNARKKHYDRHA